jgi:hypothetical protein
MNLKKGKPGHVYIFGNDELPDIIKIGESTNAEERASALSRNTATVGKWVVIWKHEVKDDNRAVEKALHYKFREFSINKEYFRIDKKRAIKIAAQVVKDIAPVKNIKAKQYRSIKNKVSKPQYQAASKNLWNDIIKKAEKPFLKEAIRLCLKEGKTGEPQYRRFSVIRNGDFTQIGRADLYILKEHIRVVITCLVIKRAIEITKETIGNSVKISRWEGGISFYITNEREFKKLKWWFDLGKKKPKSIFNFD